jgi:hypothetical protein
MEYQQVLVGLLPEKTAPFSLPVQKMLILASRFFFVAKLAGGRRCMNFWRRPQVNTLIWPEWSGERKVILGMESNSWRREIVCFGVKKLAFLWKIWIL